MSRSTFAIARARYLFVVLGLAACSLQVPKENEVFEKKSAAGGTSGDAGGADAGAGGADAGAGGSTKAKGGSSSKTETAVGGTGGAATSSIGGTTASSGGTDAVGGTSSVGGTTSTVPSPLSIGLIAHYPFNEGSGTVVNNVVDPTKNGTYVGTVAHPTGKFGPDAYLRNDGTLDFVELPPGLLTGLSAATISLWFKDRSNTRNSSLFVFGKGAAGNQLWFNPCVTKTGNYQLSGTHDGNSFVSLMSGDGTMLADSLWHNVLITWDATAISLYIDGVTKQTLASPTALPSDIDPAMPTWLGNDGAATPLYVEIDDLRIYDRVLTPELITSLFNMI